MFESLGQFVRRAWLPVIVAWCALVIVMRSLAPPFDKVAQDQEFGFLPDRVPSRLAETRFREAFPNDRSSSNIVMVFHRRAGQPPQVDNDRKFIEAVVEPALRKIAKDEGGIADEAVPSDKPLFGGDPQPSPQATPVVARIRTPNAPGAGSLLVSSDQNALLVVVELTTELLTRDNWPIVAKVEALAQDLRQDNRLPPGMSVAVTGSAVLGRDHLHAQLASIRATGTLTVVLVVILLILIYRAPLLALIPLATVFLAVQLALYVLAILGERGYLTLFQGIQIYVTILAYGAGVDYCLFLMARYKEELDRGREPAEALAHAVGGVGSAVTASAATVIGGIGMMYFAEFGKFRQAGLTIPLSLGLVLSASLTFSPALLMLAGRWAFWPQRLHEAGSRRLAPVSAKPSGGWFRAGEMQLMWDKIGEALTRRPGTIWLATVGIMTPFAVFGVLGYGMLSYDVIGDLPSNTESVAGTRLLQQHFPAGEVGPLSVLLVNARVNFGGDSGRTLVQRLTDALATNKGALGLADVRSLTKPLGITEAAQQPLIGIKASEDARKEATERAALERYVTDLGERAKIGTRLDLILNTSPFSQRSIHALERLGPAIREALPPDLRSDTQLYFTGTTASVRDLADVIRGDRTRIEILVLASVFVILIVLLRRFVVSFYLLLSVLFSYYSTLGIAIGVFWLLDPHGFTGIDWKVGIFLFTILIAVGEDYNIFLMTRVDEEVRNHGPVRGVTLALERTGPIISSCGIIMAGTFASLLIGSLSEMKQLGFALTFGVLLDTFVVRPILAPGFLILLGSGRLSFLGQEHQAPAVETPAPELQPTKQP